jgi:hypothetical protein
MYLFITKLVLVLGIGNWDVPFYKKFLLVLRIGNSDVPFYNKIGIGTRDRKLGCTFL